MDDYFEDFGEEFYDDSNDGFMEDDFMEDSFDDVEPEDSTSDESGIEDEQSDESCEDEFTVEDAVMTGIAFGWGYEEGKRRKLQRELDRDQADEVFYDRKDNI